MNAEQRVALQTLLEYMWQDEERSYEEFKEEFPNGIAARHIFEDMQVLADYLDEDLT